MKRDSFIFYRSFYEALNDLPSESQLKIYQAIAMFSLDFEQPELSGIESTIFKLIKPQLEANNKRYENGSKPKRKQNGSKTEAKQKQEKTENEAEKSKTEANKNDNVNDNVNKNDNFSFSLSKNMQLENTSREYKEKLKEYILSTGKNMTYEEFYNSCEMKGYKYKNYKLVYNKWNEDKKPSKCNPRGIDERWTRNG